MVNYYGVYGFLQLDCDLWDKKYNNIIRYNQMLQWLLYVPLLVNDVKTIASQI